MEPLSFVRSWIADLHRIGCPLAESTEREAERVVQMAEESGLPQEATIALVRDVLRRGLTQAPRTKASVGSNLEHIGIINPDRG
jgi:hypothetical protein